MCVCVSLLLLLIITVFSILGWDQLFERVANEWLHDIGSYQLPRILQGVGPLYHVTQLCKKTLSFPSLLSPSLFHFSFNLFYKCILILLLLFLTLSLSPSVQGVVDLFWLPVQQYQEDGRIVWGLQRGTYSFANSSGVAVVELTNRILYSVQVSVCILYRLIPNSILHTLHTLVSIIRSIHYYLVLGSTIIIAYHIRYSTM